MVTYEGLFQFVLVLVAVVTLVLKITKKAPTPQLFCKTDTLECAIRGSNPGHPD